jgi:hypothetical protein
MSITAVRGRIKQDIPDLGPDTVARRRLRDLEQGADRLEAAADVINTVGSVLPIVQGSIDLDPTVNESLTQIGDSPVYWTGNEPVDPRNCELWPNSPYCGGQVVDPFDIREIGFVGKVTVSLCETCFQLDPKFLGISGPSGIVCWRNDLPECQGIEPELPPDGAEPPKPNERKEFSYPAKASAGQYKLVWAWNFIETFPPEIQVEGISGLQIDWDNKDFTVETGKILSEFSYPAWTFESFDRSYQSSVFVQNLVGANPDGETVYRLNAPGQVYYQASARGWDSDGVSHRTITIVRFEWGNCPSEISEFYELIEQRKGIVNRASLFGYLEALTFQQAFAINNAFRDSKWGNYDRLTDRASIDKALLWTDESLADANGDFQPGQYFSFSPAIYHFSQACGYRKPPGNQPLPTPPRDDMACCDETLELLEAIYTRLGVDEFPVKAPALLVQENDAESTLENHAQLWEWQARNLDALMGQFPIKIKVKDSDPTTEGNQEVEIKLPNVAETLAELFGLVYQAETNGDLLVEMLLRLIPEVLATKNASLIGQSYSKRMRAL